MTAANDNPIKDCNIVHLKKGCPSLGYRNEFEVKAMPDEASWREVLKTSDICRPVHPERTFSQRPRFSSNYLQEKRKMGHTSMMQHGLNGHADLPSSKARSVIE
jgi:hypothetical protein